MTYPSEQDAALNVRISAETKAWLVCTAKETPDRNMSDLVREAIRLYQMFYELNGNSANDNSTNTAEYY